MRVKLIAQLKCIYTNAGSRGNKQDELEAIVQQDNYDSVAIMETWLTFCGLNVINHFLCDIDSCLALSCSDIWPMELATFLVSIIVVVAFCVVTLVSYIYILSSILRIQSAHGQKKASAHLSVVTIWYGSTMFLYVKPSAPNSLDLNKLVNTFTTVVTPLLNLHGSGWDSS
ncbi:PREDICTED: olfactory receptor 6F1-like [Chaetura pelagica]|uniref:olfactory receptor 6F1-like n=1 Tax=Chaetura pelagica TaxID=8897 RepID=UPI00052365C6|nr:PREDICTED: olfactory receptor 6F1-like [Chaetura pelagica]